LLARLLGGIGAAYPTEAKREKRARNRAVNTEERILFLEGIRGGGRQAKG